MTDNTELQRLTRIRRLGRQIDYGVAGRDANPRDSAVREGS